MHGIDSFAHHALRAPQGVDALRAARTATSTARYEPGSAAEASTKAKATRRSLSRNRVANVSKCALCVRAARTAVTGLRDAARLVRGLTHRDGSNHLHGIGGSGLAKLSASLGDILVFAGILRSVVLVLAIQSDLLEGTTPASGTSASRSVRLPVASAAGATTLRSVAATTSSSPSRVAGRRGCSVTR